MSWRAAALAPILLLPAACATAPPRVEAVQAQPLTPGVFRLAQGAADPGAKPTVAEQVAADALQKRGFKLAAEGQAPDYLLQVAAADRPKAARAALPQAAGDPTPLQATPPGSLHSWLSHKAYDVRIEMLDARTGAPAYAARLSQLYRKPAPGDLPALVTAALEPLKLH